MPFTYNRKETHHGPPEKHPPQSLEHARPQFSTGTRLFIMVGVVGDLDHKSSTDQRQTHEGTKNKISKAFAHSAGATMQLFVNGVKETPGTGAIFLVVAVVVVGSLVE
jgi:hypothetical protein|tara:strand:- start:123 stop:446 length:324 start_codon:yes stop_codon:yes gene_type:complete